MPVRFADLVLESEIDLPALPRAAGAPECFFRLDAPGPPLHHAQRWDHHWRTPGGVVSLSSARDGNDYRLGVPDLATFVVSADGRGVVCRPETALPAETLEHLLIDQILPRVLTHRGRIAIHAGCVSTSAGAIAFLGNSGAGKSTLCAAFAREGYPLLGDDGIVLRCSEGGGFQAVATYPGLRLFPGPLARLFGERTEASPVAHTTEKLRMSTESPALSPLAGPTPLHRVYVLEPAMDDGRPDDITIVPATAREAFLAFVRSSFQLHLDDPERSRGMFERIGALVEAVCVRRLAYPRDLERLPELVETILSDAGVATLASSEGSACN